VVRRTTWRGKRGDGAALNGDDRTGDEDNTSDFVFDFGTKQRARVGIGLR
jgi:hypothetical protein